MGEIETLQNKLGHEFEDRGLLNRALTHRSKSPDNNERLEFLGDSILGFVVAEWLYERFPGVAEGKLSRMRSTVVRKETLTKIARSLNIQNNLILGEGELKSGGHNRDSILADAMEALIGAVYLDSGMEKTKEVVTRHFDDVLQALTPKSVYKDPKSILQEYLQQRSLPLPVYEVVQIEGEPHRQTFQVSCTVQGYDEPFIAVGSSRRSAEQLAAKKAFSTLNA
ncbi:MAG: ribonuclease III [Arenicellales bacterium]|nr:ribonuclease III [Arenicellales bacterium]